MVLFKSLELSLWVGAGKRNVLVSSIERLGQVHLQTFRRSDNHMGSTVVLEKLGEAETSRASAEHEDGRAELRGNLFESVTSARSRLEESSIDIGEVVDLENLAGRVGAVFGETTVHCGDNLALANQFPTIVLKNYGVELGLTGNSMSFKMLTQ